MVNFELPVTNSPTLTHNTMASSRFIERDFNIYGEHVELKLDRDREDAKPRKAKKDNPLSNRGINAVIHKSNLVDEFWHMYLDGELSPTHSRFVIDVVPIYKAVMVIEINSKKSPFYKGANFVGLYSRLVKRSYPNVESFRAMLHLLIYFGTGFDSSSTAEVCWSNPAYYGFTDYGGPDDDHDLPSQGFNYRKLTAKEQKKVDRRKSKYGKVDPRYFDQIKKEKTYKSFGDMQAKKKIEYLSVKNMDHAEIDWVQEALDYYRDIGYWLSPKKKRELRYLVSPTVYQEDAIADRSKVVDGEVTYTAAMPSMTFDDQPFVPPTKNAIIKALKGNRPMTPPQWAYCLKNHYKWFLANGNKPPPFIEYVTNMMKYSTSATLPLDSFTTLVRPITHVRAPWWNADYLHYSDTHRQLKINVEKVHDFIVIPKPSTYLQWQRSGWDLFNIEVVIFRSSGFISDMFHKLVVSPMISDDLPWFELSNPAVKILEYDAVKFRKLAIEYGHTHIVIDGMLLRHGLTTRCRIHKHTLLMLQLAELDGCSLSHYRGEWHITGALIGGGNKSQKRAERGGRPKRNPVGASSGPQVKKKKDLHTKRSGVERKLTKRKGPSSLRTKPKGGTSKTTLKDKLVTLGLAIDKQSFVFTLPPFPIEVNQYAIPGTLLRQFQLRLDDMVSWAQELSPPLIDLVTGHFLAEVKSLKMTYRRSFSTVASGQVIVFSSSPGSNLPDNEKAMLEQAEIRLAVGQAVLLDIGKMKESKVFDLRYVEGPQKISAALSNFGNINIVLRTVVTVPSISVAGLTPDGSPSVATPYVGQLCDLTLNAVFNGIEKGVPQSLANVFTPITRNATSSKVPFVTTTVPSSPPGSQDQRTTVAGWMRAPLPVDLTDAVQNTIDSGSRSPGSSTATLAIRLDDDNYIDILITAIKDLTLTEVIPAILPGPLAPIAAVAIAGGEMLWGFMTQNTSTPVIAEQKSKKLDVNGGCPNGLRTSEAILGIAETLSPYGSSSTGFTRVGQQLINPPNSVFDSLNFVLGQWIQTLVNETGFYPTCFQSLPYLLGDSPPLAVDSTFFSHDVDGNEQLLLLDVDHVVGTDPDTSGTSIAAGYPKRSAVPISHSSVITQTPVPSHAQLYMSFLDTGPRFFNLVFDTSDPPVDPYLLQIDITETADQFENWIVTTLGASLHSRQVSVNSAGFSASATVTGVGPLIWDSSSPGYSDASWDPTTSTYTVPISGRYHVDLDGAVVGTASITYNVTAALWTNDGGNFCGQFNFNAGDTLTFSNTYTGGVTLHAGVRCVQPSTAVSESDFIVRFQANMSLVGYIDPTDGPNFGLLDYCPSVVALTNTTHFTFSLSEPTFSGLASALITHDPTRVHYTIVNGRKHYLSTNLVSPSTLRFPVYAVGV